MLPTQVSSGTCVAVRQWQRISTHANSDVCTRHCSGSSGGSGALPPSLLAPLLVEEVESGPLEAPPVDEADSADPVLELVEQLQPKPPRVRTIARFSIRFIV